MIIRNVAGALEATKRECLEQGFEVVKVAEDRIGSNSQGNVAEKKVPDFAITIKKIE